MQLLPGVAFENSDTFFPRSYALHDAHNAHEFQADFHTTAALAVLRRHVDAVATARASSLRDQRVHVRCRLVAVALRIVEQRVNVLRGACVGVDEAPVAVTAQEQQALLECVP